MRSSYTTSVPSQVQPGSTNDASLATSNSVSGSVAIAFFLALGLSIFLYKRHITYRRTRLMQQIARLEMLWRTSPSR